MDKGQKLIVIFFLSFLAGYSFAQTEEDVNLQKYWYYRWRFQNDFIKIGDQPGHSIPIQSRKGIQWVQDIEVVDGTIYLGIYLSVLATEHRLLRENGSPHDLEKNKRELYYAIRAFERLDKAGEELFGLPGKVDGYFTRDDVRCDFLDSAVNPENYAHFNQLKTRAPGTTAIHTIQTSDYCYPDPERSDLNDPRIAGEMSQDQVVWLLMGFALVEKSTKPELDTVWLNDSTSVLFNFNEEVRRHATNVINYMKYKIPHEAGKANWRIYRPDGQLVHPGHNASGFRYPFERIGHRLYTDRAENPIPFGKPKGRFVWNLMKIWLPYKNVNHPMVSSLAAVSGHWGKNPEKTAKRIFRKWRKDQWHLVYLPMMAYLHDIDITKYAIYPEIQRELSRAPAFGPYNFTDRDIFEAYATNQDLPLHTAGWNRHFKFYSSRKKQEEGSADPYIYRGFYAGMDYMLLFNLHYLTHTDSLPKYMNLIDRTVDLRDSITQRGDFAVQSFNSIHLIAADSLQSPIGIRTGFDVMGEDVYLKIRQRLINVWFNPFNPWEKENKTSNSYGWEERFERTIHR